MEKATTLKLECKTNPNNNLERLHLSTIKKKLYNAILSYESYLCIVCQGYYSFSFCTCKNNQNIILLQYVVEQVFMF